MNRKEKRTNPQKNLWLVNQPILGTRLYKVAVEIAQKTPKYGLVHYSDVLKKVRDCKGRKRIVAGSNSVYDAAQHVLDTALAIRERRQKKRTYPLHHWNRPRFHGPALPKRRIPLRYGFREDQISPWLKGETPSVRRDKVAKEEFRAYLGLAGSRASGGHSLQITLTDNPSEIGFVSNTYRTWGRRYPKTRCEQFATIPRQWRYRVVKQRLHTLEGVCVLDATLVGTHEIPDDTIRIYRAIWAEQSKGYSVNVQTGFIARSRRDYATSTFRDSSALRALLRRLNPPSEEDKTEKLLARYLAKYADVRVTYHDARHFGYCSGGIVDWCIQANVDVNGGATVAQIIAGYRKVPREEVLRVLRYVVRYAPKAQSVS